MPTLWNRCRVLLPALAACLVLVAELPAAPPRDEAPMGAFKAPEGWKVEQFAQDPQLANPVAIAVDERGRVYVAEEYRFNRGTEENRTRPFLLEDDLQVQTVDDRLAMYRKWAEQFEGGMSWFSKYADQVRRLEDRDGDGKADRSTIFAGGFNGTLDGLASGVIARDGDVYFTCIPNLWLLRDTDGDGKADVRKVLLHGFGVSAGFLGHDLHGLVWGPDGKLYFSIGDRGFHVATREGTTLHGPRTGAVFRCNPDGSGFEVVARGLRNPQELAFDACGNLFAADNNCDKGDHSRLVYVVEGGDSGWNMAYQTIPEPYLTGPWHAERLWHLPHAGQAAWIVPPVGKLGAGPSGFVTYPGVGLPDRYNDHFFYCNFTGNGGVESFAVRPKGAGFEIVDFHDVLKPVSATDVEFGYDGKMYVSEFGRLAWDGSNRAGRIFTVFDPAHRRDPAVRQVEALFKAGFRQRPAGELADLLGHPDMRVRLRAQYALAERGEAVEARLTSIAASSASPAARRHALWGLGQVARTHPEAIRAAIALLADPAADIRAQAARVLGDARFAPAAVGLITLLKDPDSHVRLRAALALGKLRHRPAAEPLFAMIRENADRDPFLRHAAVMGLLGPGDPDVVLPRAGDPSPAVRMAVLLVLRRLGDPRVAHFLDDNDLALVAEAARAINDLPIESATEPLGRLLARPGLSGSDAEPALRRAINANFRLGRPENARLLIAFAADSTRPLPLRDEALAALSDWTQPPHRDRVNGFWRPLPSRAPTALRAALDELASQLLAATSGALQARAIDLIAKQGARADRGFFLDRLNDRGADPAIRLAAFRLLAGRKDPSLPSAVETALADPDASVRAEARGVLASLDPDRAFTLLERLLNDATAPLTERQRGLATLAVLQTPKADALLRDRLQRLVAGQVPAGLQLDLLESAARRTSPALSQALAQVEAARSKTDALAAYRVCLEGGDAERGRSLFKGHAQAQCIRCHRIQDSGGTAGPDLSTVGARGDREFLLQSLIDPDAKIAAGFGTIALALRDGRVVTGVIKAEDKEAISVETSSGQLVSIRAGEIDERSPPRSAMPKMGTTLTPRELRDLVEYLATRK